MKKELSKVNTGVQPLFWRLLYSFYIHLERSAELRAIRFALEKSKGKDVIEFLVKIKEMVIAILSLNWDTFFMDEQFIEPVDLSQIFSAVYDGKSVSKMHLLSSIQNRCDTKGISAGEFAAMLLVDFVKTREKEELGSPKRSDKGSSDFLENKAMARTREKFALSYGSHAEEPAETHLQDHFKGTEFGSPNRALTERNLKAKSGYELDWASSKTKTFSERKATNPNQVKKEQKKAMM